MTRLSYVWQGCDGSVLLASTDDNQAERDADVNLSLAGDGFDAVVKAKEAVEKACPGVVSCADLLAIATRDLIGLVKVGHRLGAISIARFYSHACIHI